LRKGKRKQAEELPHVNINERIKAKELRVIFDAENGDGNFGIISKEEALEKAKELNMDLIEISPNANPPVAKIMDYGKFQYDQKKKIKAQKAKAKNVEVKGIQIRIGTDPGGLALKAKQASGWLEEGHRVKLELFLPGRSKYLDENFLNERLERLRKFITVEHKIAEESKKNPKGLSMIVEKIGSSKKQNENK
jgi:translation initiation factor IF-3